jgi:hypothetical protein
MEVSRSRLSSAPETVQIGRLTDNGWELLETKVVAQNSETVVYEAQTPGFSIFAAFDGPDVEYEWTLSDGSTVQGPTVQSVFTESGLYTVTLTVTDGLGNTDTAEYRILVKGDSTDSQNETTGPDTDDDDSGAETPNEEPAEITMWYLLPLIVLVALLMYYIVAARWRRDEDEDA